MDRSQLLTLKVFYHQFAILHMIVIQGYNSKVRGSHLKVGTRVFLFLDFFISFSGMRPRCCQDRGSRGNREQKSSIIIENKSKADVTSAYSALRVVNSDRRSPYDATILFLQSDTRRGAYKRTRGSPSASCALLEPRRSREGANI